ncbi:MAG: hypothetical protein KC609_13825 [Myxococcales bacterium]|nr:hypothetical protein [Myxococcales bacterium]
MLRRGRLVVAVIGLAFTMIGAKCSPHPPAQPDTPPSTTTTGVPGRATVGISCTKLETGEKLPQNATLRVGDRVRCTLRLDNSPWFTRDRFKKEGFAWTFGSDGGPAPFSGLVVAPNTGEKSCKLDDDCAPGPCIQGRCRPTRYRALIPFSAWSPYHETLDDAERDQACHPVSGQHAPPDRCDTVCCFMGYEGWPAGRAVIAYSTPPRDACAGGCQTAIGPTRTLSPKEKYAPTTRGWCDDNQTTMPNTTILGRCDPDWKFRFQGLCDDNKSVCPAGVCETDEGSYSSFFVGELQSCAGSQRTFHKTGANDVEFEAVCCKRSDGNYITIGVQKTIRATTTIDLVAVAPGKLTIGLEQRFDAGTIWDGASVALYDESSPGSSQVTLTVGDACTGPFCDPRDVVDVDAGRDGTTVDAGDPLADANTTNTDGTGDDLAGDPDAIGSLDGSPTADLTLDSVSGDTPMTGCTPGQTRCKDPQTLEQCRADGSGWESTSCADVCNENAGSASCTLDLSSWTVLSLVNPESCDYSSGAQNPMAPAYEPSADKKTTTQKLNAPPSTLLHGAELSKVTIRGRFRVSTSADDDYIGFVFGFNGTVSDTPTTVIHPVSKKPEQVVLPDPSEPTRYFLVDWKQQSQSVTLSSSTLRLPLGLGLKYVEHGDVSELQCLEFWDPAYGGHDHINVLLDNARLPIGWKDQTEYEFELNWGEDDFTIRVREGQALVAFIEVDWIANRLRYGVPGSPERVISPLPIANPNLTKGRFGFYNNSQEQVVYSNFTVEPLCTAGATRCSGTTLFSCNAGGNGETRVDCAASNQVCQVISGVAACRPCAPDATRCQGEMLMKCTSDGSGWQSVADCSSGGKLGCVAHTPTEANCRSCDSSTSQCIDANTLELCRPDGSGTQTLECLASTCQGSSGTNSCTVRFDTPHWKVVQGICSESTPVPSSWNAKLSPEGTRVKQTTNNDPAIFLHDAMLSNVKISATFVIPSTGDPAEDWAGFVFGYQGPEELTQARFYLLDWRQKDQTETKVNYTAFLNPSTPLLSKQGLRLKLVQSNHCAPVRYCCRDIAESVNTENVTILYEDPTPYELGKSYRFELTYRPGSIAIRITKIESGTVVIDFVVNDSTLAAGRFGLYTRGQPNVEFSNLTIENLP